MITYVDTSTLVKLLIDEVGTTEAGRIWDDADVLTMIRVGHVEARAALAAARQQRRMSAPVFRDAVVGLELLWSQVSVVEIDEQLMRLAGRPRDGAQPARLRRMAPRRRTGRWCSRLQQR